MNTSVLSAMTVTTKKEIDYDGMTYEAHKAPELYNPGEKCSMKSDLYALGVIIYQLCEYSTPFTSVKSQINYVAPMIDDCYSKDFRKLVARMLNRVPADRPSAKDLLRTQLLKDIK